MGGPAQAQAQPSTGFLLAYAHTVAARHADEVLRPHGLTVRQYGVLTQLSLEPELTTAELARQFGVSRQSLHELVGELERSGHLRRAPGATGRTRRLVVTPRTERLLGRLSERLAALDADRLGLDAKETQALRWLLRKLLAHATDDETWLPSPQRQASARRVSAARERRGRA